MFERLIHIFLEKETSVLDIWLGHVIELNTIALSHSKSL